MRVDRVTLPFESGRCYREPITFELDHANYDWGPGVWWGMVAMDRLHDVDIHHLRLVGAEDEWLPRFNRTSDLRYLCGLEIQGGRNIRIRRLEIMGFPNYGLLYEGVAGLRIDSMRAERCEAAVQGRFWTIDQHGFVNLPSGMASRGVDFGELLALDMWSEREPADPNRWRSKSLRRASDLVAGGTGAVYQIHDDFSLRNMTWAGDGSAGWKLSGSHVRVENYSGSECFISGIPPENLTLYPGEHFAHLHRAVDFEVDRSRFISANTSLRTNRLLTCSHPRTEPAVVRRSVFVRGAQHRYVAQMNWQTVRFEACNFVGWADAADAFQLSPAAGPGLPAGQVIVSPDCRYWAS